MHGLTMEFRPPFRETFTPCRHRTFFTLSGNPGHDPRARRNVQARDTKARRGAAIGRSFLVAVKSKPEASSDFRLG